MHPDFEEEAVSRRPSSRRGYALVLVMVFVVLFGATLGVAWRRVASALRVEHFSAARRQCDKGAIQVLADAMNVLETRLRWNNSLGNSELNVSVTATPEYLASYDCKSRMQYDLSDNPARHDWRWYKISFNRLSDGPNQWSISVTIAPQSEDFNSSTIPMLPE
jgi:hypothetical protein